MFRAGEKIEIPGRGILGWVQSQTLGNTTIMLVDGSPLTIPNGELARATIINRSRVQQRRIAAGFRVPNRHVAAVRGLAADMEAYLRRRPEILDQPRTFATRVVVGEVTDFAVELSVQAYVPAPGMSLVEFERVRHDIVLRLGEMISEAGVPLYEAPTSRVELVGGGGGGVAAAGGAQQEAFAAAAGYKVV